MAIGFGPGSDMVRKTNKQRSSRKKRSLKESSDQTLVGSDTQVGLKFKEATPEKLAEIRAEMKARNRKSMLLTVVLVALIVVAAVLGGIYL